jgi:hypothetical protein
MPRAQLNALQAAVLADAEQQTRDDIVYKDGYFVGGDPPPKIGVCTDVVMRAYRAAGVDLKRAVNADIRRRRGAYRITKPDPNIDYRRTRNLDVFFKRYAKQLPIEGARADWRPGDIVIFDTRSNGYPDHIAVVANGIAQDGGPTIIHHWPGHYVMQSEFVGWLPILHHYRWQKG